MKTAMAMRVIAPIAEMQDGLVTTSQAAAVGVPRLALSRLESRGDLERMAHGVYRIPGAHIDSLTDLRADWLALDPSRTAPERARDLTHAIVVSHRSAAAVYRIGNLYTDTHQYTARIRKQSSRPGVSISTRRIEHEDITIAQGMLVTTVERTIVDLALSEPNLSDVADTLADASRRNIVDLATLAPMLDAAATRHAARTGAELLHRMLEQHGLDMASAARTLLASPAMRDILENNTPNPRSEPGPHDALVPLRDLPSTNEILRIDQQLRQPQSVRS
jgi:predicted transcriptional regulator of viral defense system